MRIELHTAEVLPFLPERKAVGAQLRGIREVAEANTVEGPIGEGAKFKIQPIGGTPR